MPLLEAVVSITLATLSPPAHFDYKPKIPMETVRLAPSQVHTICSKFIKSRPRARIEGCAIRRRSSCTIYIPHNASNTLIRHERAHCNGWKHR